MNETKDALKARLKKEGRWDDALLTYEETLFAYREENGPRERFVQLSWEAVEKEYPPLPVEPELEPEEEAEEVYEFTADSGSLKDFASDVEWVYANLGVGDKYTRPPPSSGALEMLDTAREHKKDFFNQLWIKAVQQNEKNTDTTTDESKQANLDHIKTLDERIGHLQDIP